MPVLDVSVPDVLQGARNTWGTSATLLAVVPLARVYAFGVPSGTALPYVAVKLDDVSAYFGGTEYYSGGSYTKVNKINFEVYAKVETVDWPALAQELGNVFGWNESNPGAAWVIPNAERVLSSMPETDKFEQTNERIDGQPVMKYASQYSVTIQANRG